MSTMHIGPDDSGSAASRHGFSGFEICWRHLLPNLAPLIIAQATVSFGYVIVDLAAISFLGLGVQPPARTPR